MPENFLLLKIVEKILVSLSLNIALLQNRFAESKIHNFYHRNLLLLAKFASNERGGQASLPVAYQVGWRNQ